MIDGRLVDPADWHDPYPIYRAARAAAPILAVPEWDELICTRWADCERILRDPAFSSSVSHRRRQPAPGRGGLSTSTCRSSCSWTRPTTRGCGGW